MNFALKQVRDRIVLAVGAALLSACASVGSGPSATRPNKGTAVTAPSLGLFSSIKAPSDREPVLQLSAQGVQVFRCEKRDGAFVWTFRQPDAQLLDAYGKVVGRHGANFSFEHVDGSRLVATIAAYDDAPKSADLRWLLLIDAQLRQGRVRGRDARPAGQHARRHAAGTLRQRPHRPVAARGFLCGLHFLPTAVFGRRLTTVRLQTSRLYHVRRRRLESVLKKR